MEAPAHIYLDHAIELPGNIKIHHTPEGLKYMIDHITIVLKVTEGDKTKMPDSMREFNLKLIGKYKEHVQLYEAGIVKKHLEAATA